MKKFFFMAAAATALFAACNKTEVVYTDGPQEIAMFAVSNTATKAPVTGTAYPDDNMQVAAYLASGTAGNYFGQTKFVKGSGTYVGSPAQYWPVTDATINFLAVSESQTPAVTTITFDATTPASAAKVVLADNSSAQYDLMYAAGQGVKTSSTPAAVDMVFKHALSWICFEVKAAEADKITVKSITLNDAVYNGTLDLANDEYNKTTAYESVNASVTPSWSSKGEAKDVLVSDDDYICTTSYVPYGTGLLVVPNTATTAGFTIVYSTGAGDITYTANFTKPTEGWVAGKKYTYQISFGALAEIEINPTVTDWVSGEGETVTL